MARERKPKMDVIMSYEEYCKLLKDLEQVPKLRQEVQRLEQLYVGLYQLYQEIIDRVGVLMKQI